MNAATLEVVALPNGRFSVRPIGAVVQDDEEGEFDTQQEAEAWMFDHNQRQSESGGGFEVIKPGQGQGWS